MTAPPLLLTLAQYATISAQIDSGFPQEEVLGAAGVSSEIWEASRAAWLERMLEQAERQRFALSDHYAKLYAEQRKEADQRRRVERRPLQGEMPVAPAVGRLIVIAPELRAEWSGAAQAPLVPPSAVRPSPGSVPFVPAAVAPPPLSSAAPSVPGSVATGAPASVLQSSYLEALAAQSRQPARPVVPEPGPLSNAPAPNPYAPPSSVGLRAPVAPPPSVIGAAPIAPPPSVIGVAPVAPPPSVFGASSQPSPPLAHASQTVAPQTVAPQTVAPQTAGPQTAAPQTPARSVMNASYLEALAGQSRGLGSTQGPQPAQPAPGPQPTPYPQPAPPQPTPPQPAPYPQPQPTSLTLEQFAALRAELVVYPEAHHEQLRARYRMVPGAWEHEERTWNERFAADRALFQRYIQLFQAMRARLTPPGR